MIKISVIIPTYNNMETISAAIDSVLGQTYPASEIIVIDDGSTDLTAKEISVFHERVRYAYQSNQERSNARNHGIRLAKGEWVAFLDADDWWLPNKLQRQVEMIRSNPNLGMVHSQAYMVDEAGRHLAITGSGGDMSSLDGFYSNLLMGNLVPSPTPLIRREVLLKAGGFDESLRQGEDWDCWLRVAQITTVRFIPEPLACYRAGMGADLLKKMAKRGGTDAAIRIIRKAVQRGNCPREVFDRAMALAQFESALIETGTAQVDQAGIRLASIQDQFPGFLQENQELILSRTCDLAAQLCLGTEKNHPGEDFLRAFWAAMPKGIYPESLLRKLLARLHAVRFFQAGQVKNQRLMRHSLLPMMTNDPAWLRNRGVWSVLIRPFLPNRRIYD